MENEKIKSRSVVLKHSSTPLVPNLDCVTLDKQIDNDYQEMSITPIKPTVREIIAQHKFSINALAVYNHYTLCVPWMIRAWAVSVLIASGASAPIALPPVATYLPAAAFIESVPRTLKSVSYYQAALSASQPYLPMDKTHIIGPLERLLLNKFNQNYQLSPPGAVR